MNINMKYTNVYKSKYFMYQYNDTNFRILKQKFCRDRGFELIEKAKKIIKTDKEDCQRISLSRSKRFIREISLCNNFDYFVTLTVNKENCDRYDVDVCQEHLRHILKNYQLNMKKTYKKDFKYILITERHKDGAFHFHRFNETDWVSFILTVKVICLASILTTVLDLILFLK